MTNARPGFSGSLRQWLPVGVLVALIAAAYGTGLYQRVSLQALAQNRELLREFVDANLVLAVALFLAIGAARIPSLGAATLVDSSGQTARSVRVEGDREIVTVGASESTAIDVQEYGTAFTSPGFVQTQIEALVPAPARWSVEPAWFWAHQDAFVLQRPGAEGAAA